MQEERRKKPSALAVVKTVLSSFIGIRRKSGHEADAVRLTPVQIAIAAVAGAAVFVLLLVAFVRFIVSSAS